MQMTVLPLSLDCQLRCLPALLACCGVVTSLFLVLQPPVWTEKCSQQCMICKPGSQVDPRNADPAEQAHKTCSSARSVSWCERVASRWWRQCGLLWARAYHGGKRPLGLHGKGLAHCVADQHEVALVPWHLPLDPQQVACRVHLQNTSQRRAAYVLCCQSASPQWPCLQSTQACTQVCSSPTLALHSQSPLTQDQVSCAFQAHEASPLQCSAPCGRVRSALCAWQRPCAPASSCPCTRALDPETLLRSQACGAPCCCRARPAAPQSPSASSRPGNPCRSWCLQSRTAEVSDSHR